MNTAQWTSVVLIWMAAAVLLMGLFLMAWVWYVLVVLVLSSDGPRAFYLRAKTPLDRVAAVIMGGLGARLAYSAVRE
jgi:threonine/homoserine/homoserine lactone efflux protein